MKIHEYTAILTDNGLPELKKKIMAESKINQIKHPEDAAAIIQDMFMAGKLAEEYVWMIAMDTAGHPIGVFELSHGTIDCTVCQPREIFVRLCLCGASTFILIHNHPSNSLQPSREDKNLTKSINDVAMIMGIKLLDHIIIGRTLSDVFSMADAGFIM